MSQPRFLKTISAVIVILLGLTMMTTSLMAQSTTSGAVSGVVTDATGAVVPGAKVEVKNVGTNDVTTATSDEGGRYHAVNLQPGKYEVKVAASNFAAFKASCTVEVGRITDVDAKLNAAGGAETVEVKDEAPVINTEHQDFANNIDQTSIQNLPINGRRWSNYALLTPSANPDGTFGLISFRGISGLLNNNTIDGGDNNSNFWGEERGRTRLSYSTSQDAVKEFQVNTSNYSAEYGRSAGGAVNTVTKSGTNNLHGSGYWYFRDNALGATNPSTTLNGVPFKPDDRRQQFGGTLGGPIVKDKMFFFFNYDQQKRNFPGDAIPLANTAGYQYSSGPFTVAAPATACPAPNAAFPNNYTLGNAIYCRFGQNQALAQAASDAGYGFFTSLLGLTPRTGDQLIFFPKVDYKVLGGNWSTSYNWLNWTSPSGIQTQPTNTIAKDQFGSDLVRTRALNSIFNRPIGNSALEAKFHWSTETLSGDFGTDLPGQAEVAGILGPHVPGASITGFLNIGTQSYLPRPALPQETQYQESVSLLFNKSKHTIKMGGEILHQSEDVQSLNQAYGTFNYPGNFGFANFLADTYNSAANNFTGSGVKRCGTVATPTPCYSNLFQSIGILGYDYGTNDYAGFIQDDYKILPRLNINMGLRYEYEAFPAPQFVNPLAPATNNTVNDTNNFGPRIGFAYDVFGTGKLVVRGGYGLYYGRIINSTIAGALTSTGLTTAQPNFTISPSATSPAYPNLATSGTSSAPGIVFYAPGLGNPMVHESDAIVEYEVVKNTVVSVSYLNSMGRGLLNFLDTNLPAVQGTNTFTRPDGTTFTTPTYGTGARPNASFNQMTKITNSVDSDYNAFVAQVTRRMTSNWQMQASYTYSRSTDNGQNSTTFTTGNNALDPNNPQNEFGPSQFDVPHKFIATAVWQPNYFKDSNKAAHYILDGWTLAPIVNLSSGFTYTGVISGNLPFTQIGGVGANVANCASTHNSGINCAVPGFGDNRPPDVEKNSFRSPGRYTTDYRMSRTINTSERTNVEFIAEAFNLFNHPNVSGINNSEYGIGTCSGNVATNNLSCPLTALSSFGTPSSIDGGTNLRERQIQFAVRFSF